MEFPLALLGIEEEGEKSPPETRLKTASDARRLLSTLVQEDNNGRSWKRAVTKGMVDGNPPYDDRQLRTERRTWETNVNFGEGQAIMNRTGVPYYNLFARVPYYADCKTEYQPAHPNHEQWNARITDRFDKLLKRWPEFNPNIQQVSYWMRLHGIGFPFFDRDYDWRFRSIDTGSVMVPIQSPACLGDRIPYVAIQVPYRITELWERIKDPDTAEKAGWNVAAVRNAIRFGMKGVAGGDWYSKPWEWYQERLKNSDLVSSFTDADVVKCAYLLVKEFTKPGEKSSISKFLFTEHKVELTNPQAVKPDQDTSEFLYRDIDCYESYLECLVPFFRNIGDGTWHSVRGYAMEAFKHVELDNRILCQLFNRTFIDCSVVLQSQTARGRERTELAVFGAVTRLPIGSEFKPTTIQGGTDGPIAAHNLLRAHLTDNLGIARTSVSYRQDGRGEQPTARQVDYEAANTSSVGEAEITNWYGYCDTLYYQMFARAADPSTSDEEAKRFQKECKEDGVPPQALQKMEHVRANRQNGYGSPEMAIMRFNQGMTIFPMLPEAGKQNFVEDYVSGFFGPEKTERFAPRSHVPDDQDWQASVENQMIAGGRMPIIDGTQDDVQHLTSHLQDARQTLTPTAQDMQGGQPDPNSLGQSAQYAQIMVQHCEAHIARLKNDPGRKQQAKLFEDELAQLADFNQQIWRALRSAQRDIRIQQEQQAQATALSALDQAKVDSVRTGTATAAAKAQSQIENQRAKTIQTLNLKSLKQGHDMGLDRIQTGHEIQMDRMKTQAATQTPEETLP